MRTSPRLLFLALALVVIEKSVQWNISVSEFSKINYCNYEDSNATVPKACKTLHKKYKGSCESAIAHLTDSNQMSTDVQVTIGLCKRKGTTQNCVTDDTDSSSDLLMWKYDSGRCTPVDVKKGKGSKKVWAQSDQGTASGDGSGSSSIGLPIGHTSTSSYPAPGYPAGGSTADGFPVQGYGYPPYPGYGYPYGGGSGYN